MEKVSKVESLPEIIEEMSEDPVGKGGKGSERCPTP
jgi:hypothetical protein